MVRHAPLTDILSPVVKPFNERFEEKERLPSSTQVAIPTSPTIPVNKVSAPYG
jgi:hypothetical protein